MLAYVSTGDVGVFIVHHDVIIFKVRVKSSLMQRKVPPKLALLTPLEWNYIQAKIKHNQSHGTLVTDKTMGDIELWNSQQDDYSLIMAYQSVRTVFIDSIISLVWIFCCLGKRMPQMVHQLSWISTSLRPFQIHKSTVKQSKEDSNLGELQFKKFFFYIYMASHYRAWQFLQIHSAM